MNQETSAAAEPPERPAAGNPGMPQEPASPAASTETPSLAGPDAEPEIAATPPPPPEATSAGERGPVDTHAPTAGPGSVAPTTPVALADDLRPAPASTMIPGDAEAPPPPPVTPTRRARGLPPWLPMFALAVVPALIVGVLVFALAGGSDSGSKSVGGVLDFFFRQGSSPENVLSFEGEAPPNFPTDFPIYDGAKVFAGFQIIPEEGNGASFYVILSTSDSIDDVYNSYIQAFDGDIWAVEIARSSDEFTGVRFTRPDDPDVSGDVTLHRSELDNRTTIFVTYQDLTPSQAIAPAGRNFVLGKSRPLPANYPSSDVPVYDSKNGESVITDTYIEKAPGGTSYVISFLTKDSQDDVVQSYRQVFEDKGWTVEDAENDSNTSFQIGISFSDGPSQGLQGTVLTDAFEEDTSYTKVDVLVQVASGRGRGN